MSQYDLTVLAQVCINIIVALGLYITINSGQLSGIHAAIMGVGGYLAGYVAIDLHGPLIATVLLAVVAGGVVGSLVASSLFRLEGFYLSVATLAAGQALVTVAENVQTIGGANGLSGVPLRVGMPLLLTSAAVVILAVRSWDRSLGGYLTRALGQDEIAAQSCGVSLRRVRFLAFLVGGALAAYAGALQAQNIGIVVPASLGWQYETLLFFYVGIGGMDSYAGAVIGAVIVTALPEFLRFSVNGRYLVFGLALALMMVFRPFGLLPRVPLSSTSEARKLGRFVLHRRGRIGVPQSNEGDAPASGRSDRSGIERPLQESVARFEEG